MYQLYQFPLCQYQRRCKFTQTFECEEPVCCILQYFWETPLAALNKKIIGIISAYMTSFVLFRLKKRSPASNLQEGIGVL